MTSEFIQIKLSKIMQTHAYTAVIVGNSEKRFPIYTEPTVGKTLQLSLTEAHHPRPLTHDLLGTILDGLNVRLKQVVITELHDTIYHARLFAEQEREGKRHVLSIDARPSDCITLALKHNLPLYCTKEVFEEALPIE